MAEQSRIGDLLVAAGAITRVQLGAALADQRSFGKPLGSILVAMGYLDEETLMRTLAQQLKLPIAWLRDKVVEDEVRDLLSAELALKHRVLPLRVTIESSGKVLYLAMESPHDLAALDAVRFQLGHTVSPVLAAASELDDALERHYGPGSAGLAIHMGDGLQARTAPEILTFGQLKAAPAAMEIPLEDVVKAAPAAHLDRHASAEAALATLLQLIEIFLDNGIVTPEELRNRLRPYLPK